MIWLSKESSDRCDVATRTASLDVQMEANASQTERSMGNIRINDLAKESVV